MTAVAAILAVALAAAEPPRPDAGAERAPATDRRGAPEGERRPRDRQAGARAEDEAVLENLELLQQLELLDSLELLDDGRNDDPQAGPR